jgi:hypothetical protein
MRMPSNQQRELDRTRYWLGQMLESGNLRGQVSTDLQLRWWHNRALHNAFGIAIGYEATALRDAAGILIGFEFEPGVAYDCYGRGLILLKRRKILLPENPQAQPVTLVARYRETDSFPDPRQTNGVCLTCCEDSLDQEQPGFVWTAASPPPDAGVPLVQVTYPAPTRQPEAQFQLVISEPLSKPYLANGSTVEGGTAWSVWSVDTLRLGLQTDVDTAAAGFSRTPCYFAWLENFDPVAFGAVPNTLISTHVTQPKPDSFRFRITIARDLRLLLKLEVALRRERPQFYVCWLGCESRNDASRCMNPSVEKACCG